VDPVAGLKGGAPLGEEEEGREWRKGGKVWER